VVVVAGQDLALGNDPDARGPGMDAFDGMQSSGTSSLQGALVIDGLDKGLFFPLGVGAEGIRLVENL